MDTSTYPVFLSFPDHALLPSSALTWLSLHLGWAIVLGALTLWIASRLRPGIRWPLAGLVCLWTLLPNAASPAFWLGLACQSPSLMSVILCLGWMLHRPGSGGLGAAAPKTVCATHLVLTMAGVLLGWVLLLDTLALLPVSVYAWGFGSSAVALALLAAALFWLALGSRTSVAPLAVLALFVLTRAPTGNLWDALIDPLLWLTLQVGCLFSLARSCWTSRRSSPATRA